MMECHNLVFEVHVFLNMVKWTHCLASKFTKPHITRTLICGIQEEQFICLESLTSVPYDNAMHSCQNFYYI